MTITPTQADEVHATRGNTAAWDAVSSKEAAIQNATDYINAFYAPFQDGVNDTTERLVIATSLLALELTKAPQPLTASQPLKSKEVESDGSSVKKTYQDADKVSSDPYPLITALLAPIRVVSANGIRFGVMTR
jgi:predicted GNAT superfamily acetyltransferase